MLPRSSAKLWLGLVSLAFLGLCQTPQQSFRDHVVWERDYQSLSRSGWGSAVSDSNGALWAVAEVAESGFLVHIRQDGTVLSTESFPPSLDPQPPSDGRNFRLAIGPSGRLAVLASYSHWYGRMIYFDGTKFSVRGDDGRFTEPRTVAGPGPEYVGVFAANDARFWALSDQSPMSVLRISPEGVTDWRRTLSTDWMWPSGAPLESGSSCIVSSGKASPQLHIVWIDQIGATLHEETIASARGSHAMAGPAGSCAILYKRELDAHQGRFFLTVYGARFHQEWTTQVGPPPSFGGEYDAVAVSDGYVVTTATDKGLFLAKYAFDGTLLWSALDSTRQFGHLATASRDRFYLLGAGPAGRRRFETHVVLAK